MAKLSPDPLQQLLPSLADSDGELLLCRCCTNPITRSDQIVTIGLSQHYRFTNPAGISYSIDCFQRAAGCTIAGTPTAEASWFSGYRWQLANCCECHEHLGWYYENSKQRHFFGLIRDRLMKADR
jgi:hypothetical protein